jgi:hypothetical protein
MKSAILLILQLILVMNGCKSKQDISIIILRHVGPNDRPLQSIIFSQEVIPIESEFWSFNIILPNETFRKIVRIDDSISVDAITNNYSNYQSFEILKFDSNRNKLIEKRISISNTLIYLSEVQKILISDCNNLEDIEKIKYLSNRIQQLKN